MDRATERRPGLITDLGECQEQVLDLIKLSREQEDPTMEESLVGDSGHEDDILIALVLAQMEVDEVIRSEPVANFHVIRAGAILDHLDTLGFTLVRKS